MKAVASMPIKCADAKYWYCQHINKTFIACSS